MNVANRNRSLRSASYHLGSYGMTTGSVYRDKFGDDHAISRERKTVNKYMERLREACAACAIKDCVYRNDPMQHFTDLRATADYDKFRRRLNQTSPEAIKTDKKGRVIETVPNEKYPEGVFVPCTVLMSKKKLTDKVISSYIEEPITEGVVIEEEPAQQQIQGLFIVGDGEQAELDLGNDKAEKYPFYVEFPLAKYFDHLPTEEEKAAAMDEYYSHFG